MHPSDAWLEVESLDLEGRGVARREDGKVVFIDGALPGERVQVSIGRRKNAWEQGQMTAIARESAQRVRAGCPHFGLHRGACGGCKIQHLHPAAQVAVKQRVLEDSLAHLAKVKPDMILRPIEGPAWGYRQRARLSVRHVAAKGTVLIGFHERKSRYVADMSVCPVLPPAVSDLLMPLRELIASMDARDRLPQIELAMGDRAMALVLRHLDPLGAADVQRLRVFAGNHAVQWWLQPRGPETAYMLDTAGEPLDYTLPEFGLRMPFKPTDFTQVNPHINRVLVETVLRHLHPRPGDSAIDWFCGLGNFTLPLALHAGRVCGIEGSATLVERARANAATNRLAQRVTFQQRDLFALAANELQALGEVDLWLIDPPREGAFGLVKAVADLIAGGVDWRPPRRIVYVGCNPATLARDAGLLVHQAGYRCIRAGVLNMFPHTAHVESVAVFDRS